MSFRANEVLPGVRHIADPMGVCCTLLTGERAALLVDTGYGMENLAAFVRTLTDKPLSVLLTHGHHDHALGAMHFDRVWLFPEDAGVYATYTNDHWRRHVLAGARANGRAADEAAFLSAPVPAWEAPPALVDLGGLSARILLCPGHTPGSAVVYVPERALLLTGDDWNPVTWLFFPEALPVRAWRTNAARLAELPFAHVLCSHRENLWPRAAFTDFVAGMTDEALRAAAPAGEGASMGINTHRAVLKDTDQCLVFDRDKFGEE